MIWRCAAARWTWRACAGTGRARRADQRLKGHGHRPYPAIPAGTAATWLTRNPPVIELPVLNDVPKCRQVGHEAGQRASYRAPAPPLVDAPPGRGVSASRSPGRWFSRRWWLRCFKASFPGRSPIMDGMQACSRHLGPVVDGMLCRIIVLRSLLVDGIWSGVGSVIVFLAADSAAVSVHRHSGGFRLSGAGRADRRPHHGAIRVAGQIVHPAAFGLCLRCSGHHGHARHREQARSHRHHHDCAAHDLLGAAAGLHAGHRGFRSQHPHLGRRSWRCRRRPCWGSMSGICGRDCRRRGC